MSTECMFGGRYFIIHRKVLLTKYLCSIVVEVQIIVVYVILQESCGWFVHSEHGCSLQPCI